MSILELGLLLVLHQAVADEYESARIEDLRSTIVDLSSADAASDDVVDLDRIGKSIGSASIVILGECHQDGGCYRAKTRLVKFLHERMGFDVLAWESSAFDCRQLAHQLPRMSTGHEIVDFPGISGLWQNAKMLTPLWDYLVQTQRTPRPLSVVGLDCKAGGMGRRSTLRIPVDFEEPGAFLRRVLRNAGWTSNQIDNVVGQIEEFLIRARGDGVTPTPAEFLQWQHAIEECARACRTQRDILIRELGVEDTLFAAMFLHSLRLFEEWSFSSSDFGQSQRDRAMFDWLTWNLEHILAGRKVIVWTGGYHGLMRPSMVQFFETSSGATVGPLTHVDSLAELCRRQFGSDVYTVGFTALRGLTGKSNSPREVPLAPDKSVERWFDRSGCLSGWLDLRSLPEIHWLRKRMPAGVYMYGDHEAVWPEVVDAIVFVRTTCPESPLAAESFADSLDWTAIAPESDLERQFLGGMKLATGLRQIDLSSELPKAAGQAASAEERGLTSEIRILAPNRPRILTEAEVRCICPSKLITPVCITKNGSIALLEGAAKSAELAIRGQATVYCGGSLDGDLLLYDAGNVFVDGSITGLLRSLGDTCVAVSRPFCGQIECVGPCAIWLRGGIDGSLGQIRASGEGVVIRVDGYSSRTMLDRLSGATRVILEESDMPVGETEIDGMSVRVLNSKK